MGELEIYKTSRDQFFTKFNSTFKGELVASMTCFCEMKSFEKPVGAGTFQSTRLVALKQSWLDLIQVFRMSMLSDWCDKDASKVNHFEAEYTRYSKSKPSGWSPTFETPRWKSHPKTHKSRREAPKPKPRHNSEYQWR